jgi:aryl-phospho-beta-D-glucosidase BglC (GH1 family)
MNSRFFASFALFLSLSACQGKDTVVAEKPAIPGSDAVAVSEYVHAQGMYIYDGSGKEIILKGVGLGGWMLQEGYMLGTSGTQHAMRTFLEGLAGKAAVDKFYDDWLTYFVTERDVDQIARWGYNSIRLPLHYNLFFNEQNQWIESGSKGLDLTDRLLRWCEKNRLYLILDLHAAPGGQGNVADIVDKKQGESLWENEMYEDMTVLMWERLAKRYAGEKWIGGYDLLNEPNYDFENSGSDRGCNCRENIPLTNLYKRIIDAIRKEDANHLLILEGNCMGGNYDGMKVLATYDRQKNLALSFHSYWGQNTQASLQGKLDLRTSWQVPLWRGEIGENSNTWFTDMVVLSDLNRIGWANWPWKKINSLDGPVVINPFPEWDRLIAFKSSPSNPRPTAQEAQVALVKMIEAIKLENCRLMHDYSWAWINLPKGEASKPYAQHRIPGVVYLTDYDYGKLNDTWSDTDYQNTSGSSSNTAWNRGEAYRNDGVDIWKSSTDSSPLSSGYFVGEIKVGEWLQFTLDGQATGSFEASVRFRSRTAGKLSLWLNGQKAGEVNISNTGNAWSDAVASGKITCSGASKLKVAFDTGGYDVSYIRFE